jgi:hypothetical protein
LRHASLQRSANLVTVVEGFCTHGVYPRSAAFRPNGSRIVVALEDRTARVFAVAPTRELAIMIGHEDILPLHGLAKLTRDEMRVGYAENATEIEAKFLGFLVFDGLIRRDEVSCGRFAQ